MSNKNVDEVTEDCNKSPRTEVFPVEVGCEENGTEWKASDFHFLRLLGRGKFSEVLLAKKDKSLYAIKMLDRRRVLDLNQVRNERLALLTIRFPFIIHMERCFSDPRYIYFVLPYIPGGDLWFHLRKVQRLDEGQSRFYTSQIVLALEHLHSLKVIYRDVKPENILLDADGYLKLADLGFCKTIQGRTYTLCGTVEYMSPEVLLNKGYGFVTDWWSFGVLLYEMVAGQSPFLDRDELAMTNNIVNCAYKMRKQFSKELQEVIRRLLEYDPTKRLGHLREGVSDVRYQQWFLSVKWSDVLNKSISPPFVPKVRGHHPSGEARSTLS